MHRTNTANLTSITLPLPDAATFVFTSSSPAPTSLDVIRIMIPPSSIWRMPLHWHPSETNANATVAAACESMICLSGSLHVYVASGLWANHDKLGSRGMSVKFKPGDRVSWNRLRKDDPVPLTVALMADQALWRNISSAVLDRDIFPRLSSTPWWLRALFAILDFIPSWKNWLLNLMLSVQLQTIFFAHDFHVYHGYVPVTWPWIAQPFGGTPPTWAKRLQIQSLYVIARAVMTLAYWAGTLFLGMKGEYVEYTPSRVHGDEKR